MRVKKKKRKQKQKKKSHTQRTITQHNKKRIQHSRISTFSCSGRQRPAHSPFLVFLFGLPSLLCPLSEHHSFLLRDPALGCGLRGLAPSHSSSTSIKTLLCTVLCLQLKSRGVTVCEGIYLLICSSLTCLPVILYVCILICYYMQLIVKLF